MEDALGAGRPVVGLGGAPAIAPAWTQGSWPSDLLETARRAWDRPVEPPSRAARIGLGLAALVPLVLSTRIGDLIVLLGLLLATGAGLVAGAVAVGRGKHRPRRLDGIVTMFGVWALGLPVWFLLGAGSITVRGLGTVSLPGGLADMAGAFTPAWMAVYPVLVAWAAWPFGDLLARGLWAAAAGLAAAGVLGAAIGVNSTYTAIPTVFGLMLVGLAWAIVREWLPVELTDRAAPSD